MNPLTGVKTALQLLERTNPSAEVHETVAAVDAEVRRVEQMARRLMSFARPSHAAAAACRSRRAAAARAARDAREPTRATVRVVPALNGVRSVTADPDLLVQVLVNLVGQRLPGDAGRRRAGRDSRARRDAAGASSRSVDRGRGLSREVAARLFTPFVTDKRDGHGLGLAVSQNIALAHGGRIEARAERARRAA